MFFELKYLGCLNRPYVGNLPFPILIAVFLIPVAKLFPRRNVAAKGDATRPMAPAPRPLKNPIAPSSFAF